MARFTRRPPVSQLDATLCFRPKPSVTPAKLEHIRLRRLLQNRLQAAEQPTADGWAPCMYVQAIQVMHLQQCKYNTNTLLLPLMEPEGCSHREPIGCCNESVMGFYRQREIIPFLSESRRTESACCPCNQSPQARHGNWASW